MVPEPRHGDGGPDGAQPAAAGPRAAQHAGGRGRWRWRAAAVLASVLLIAGLGGAALALAHDGTPPARRGGSHPSTSPPLNNEAAVRNQAVSWITHQVSRSTEVSCDAQVCADLVKSGFPSANLVILGPQSFDPLGAQLVVSTAAIRAQFGDQLAVWTPAIIAAFGSGNARIEIRLEYPGGAKSYRAVQGAYARDRKRKDALLLANRGITFSATARAQLRSGNVDPRLPALIAFMAHSHPIHIVDFGNQSPGGGPASLLRSVDLTAADAAAQLRRGAYLSWLHSVVNSQQAQFRPVLTQVTLPTGQAVLRIGYTAPSPLR